MPHPIAVVGIDLGGSWIRLQALDSAGHRLRSLKRPSVSFETLPSFLKSVWRQWGARPDCLAIGSRGIWSGTERAALARRLRGTARRVIVQSDVEAAWRAAFYQGGGILVISGTGSIAFAQDSDGCERRAGGLGPLLGDEGSAFWIGREWLRGQAQGSGLEKVLKRLRQNPFPIRHIASIATRVLSSARQGNRRANVILKEAQRALADLVAELALSMHWKGPLPLSGAGSVMEDPHFRAGFLNTLRRHPQLKQRRILWHERQMDAATAMALYALRKKPS